MRKLATRLICLCLGIVLSSCVTALDDRLPYTQLPVITVATQFSPVASPVHPTAYLTGESIAAGEQVYVLGMDNDAAWLLIVHNNTIGWMPTFYSRSNVGKLRPALRITPLAEKCTRYLGATTDAGAAWVSGVAGNMLVIGSIYRPRAGQQFQASTLSLEIAGPGTAIHANYLHPPLTATSAVVLFAFALSDLHPDSRISFSLTDSSQEPLVFQATFFSTTCADDPKIWEEGLVDHLPIGVPKRTLPKPVTIPTRPAAATASPTPTSQSRTTTPTPVPTSVIIKRPSGPSEPPPTVTLPPEVENSLRTSLLTRSQNSAVALAHRAQAEALIDALLHHLDDFQLPQLGITRRSMTDALGRSDAGARINSVVQTVWSDWQNNGRTRNFDLYTTDPGNQGFSPFRQLIIRLIQGRQGPLVDSQQHALHNYFTRNEEASVWQSDPNGVIGAINRESFRWP